MRLFDWLPFGSVPEISALQLSERLQHVQVVDVRTETEFARSHIAGAINLPIARFSTQRIAALGLDKHKPVVTICLSAHRSIPATRKLTALGYTASQLGGGMKHWWKRALPVQAAPNQG